MLPPVSVPVVAVASPAAMAAGYLVAYDTAVDGGLVVAGREGVRELLAAGA